MTSLLLNILGDLFLMLLPALVQFHAGEKLAALPWRYRQILYGLLFGAGGVGLLFVGGDHWHLAQSSIMVAAAAGMGAAAGGVSLVVLMFGDTMLTGMPQWLLLILGVAAFALGYGAYALWQRGLTGSLLSMLLLAGSLFVTDYFILYALTDSSAISFDGGAGMQVLAVYWVGLPLLGWLWHTARARAEGRVLRSLPETECGIRRARGRRASKRSVKMKSGCKPCFRICRVPCFSSIAAGVICPGPVISARVFRTLSAFRPMI